MATTVPYVDQPGDAELISAVRGGDLDAYGQLFERHVDAARRLARQIASAGEVDDLVSDAFVKVLGVLQRGGGPDVAFRAYLLTSVRRLRVDRLRAGSRLHPTDDMEKFDPGVPFRDTAVEGFENDAAARAFASLPERWQLVLWHTEVEGSKPAEVAPLLGMTPNSVSALAYRAREGLRQAFLTEHAAEAEADGCRWTHQHLGGYVRGGLSRRDTTKVESHLGECRPCMAIYLELSEVNDNLAGWMAPLLLGGFSSGYLAATQGGTAAAWLLALPGRVRDGVLAHGGASVVAGVATAGVITVGTLQLWPDAAPPTAGSANAPESQVAGAVGGGAGRGLAEGPTSAPRDGDTRSRTRPAGDSRGADPDSSTATGTSTSRPTDTSSDPTSEGTTDTGTDSTGTTPTDTDAGETPSPPPAADFEQTEPGSYEPPPGADVTVRAARSGPAPAYTVTATVGGVPRGAGAVLRVEVAAGDLAAFVPLQAGCTLSPGGIVTWTCRLTGDGTRTFTATAPLGATLRLHVTSPADEVDPTNNVTTVRLPALDAG